MELLFITLAGAIIGMIARYVFPNRDRHGALLIPAVGAAVGAVVWVALTWAGLAWDGGWIWFISLIVTAVFVGIADPLVGIYRARADVATLVSLRSPSPSR